MGADAVCCLGGERHLSSLGDASGTGFHNCEQKSEVFLFSGPQKGPAERGHVKKRQKSSKSVKNIFDTFRHFSRRAKNVKNRPKVSKIFRHFLTIFAGHQFSGPFWEALICYAVADQGHTNQAQWPGTEILGSSVWTA